MNLPLRFLLLLVLLALPSPLLAQNGKHIVPRSGVGKNSACWAPEDCHPRRLTRTSGSRVPEILQCQSSGMNSDNTGICCPATQTPVPVSSRKLPNGDIKLVWQCRDPSKAVAKPCPRDYFLVGGKCIRCPPGTKLVGDECVAEKGRTPPPVDCMLNAKVWVTEPKSAPHCVPAGKCGLSANDTYECKYFGSLDYTCCKSTQSCWDGKMYHDKDGDHGIPPNGPWGCDAPPIPPPKGKTLRSLRMAPMTPRR